MRGLAAYPLGLIPDIMVSSTTKGHDMARQLYIVDDKGQVIDLRDKVFLVDSTVSFQDAEIYGIRLDNFNMQNCFMGDDAE